MGGGPANTGRRRRGSAAALNEVDQPNNVLSGIGRPFLLEHDNLEDFQDPQYYDLEDLSDTGLAFYRALAEETGIPILELGCGTGCLRWRKPVCPIW